MSEFQRIDNPYIIGNPLRGGQPFFGREDNFAYAKQRLRTEREGIVLVFVGGRRSGKTSIMFQIVDGQLGPDFLPVFIDMQALSGIEGDNEFLSRVARTIIESIDDERLVADYYDFGQGAPIPTFDQLLGDVNKVFPDRRLLLLVDEAELLRDRVARGEISSNVLTFMASALESRRVSYLFTGSPGLAEAEVAEWKRLLGKGERQEITFLTPADTARLVQEPAKGQVTYEEGVVGSIYQLTFGQPFYTQLICTTAIDHLNTAQRRHLTQEDLDEVVRTLVNSPPPQLLYDWEQFDTNECLSLSLLSEVSDAPHTPVAVEELVASIDENEYPIELSAADLHMILEGLDGKMVLARSDEGGYHFLVDLVRLWIKRSRSVWRLVEEQEDEEVGRPAWAIPAAVVGGLAVIAVVVFALRGPSDDASPRQPVGPTTGTIWVEEFPEGTEIEILGPLEGGNPIADVGGNNARGVPDREPGSYVVTATNPLYTTQVETLRVQEGLWDTIFSKVVRLEGNLSVQPAQPMASLSIVDSVGVTHYTGIGAVAGLSLPTGTYDISASLDGYLSRPTQVEVRRDEDVSIPIDLSADVGDLRVVSEPPGATVWVANRESGTTPITISDLPTGRHNVSLVLLDHELKDTTATISFSKVETLRVSLFELPGTLDISSTPRAAIWLNGVALGDSTPYRHEHPAGRYEIRLEADGFDPLPTAIDLAPGKMARVNRELDRQYGWVRFTRPATGALIVDGVEARHRPLKPLRLSVGKHTIGLVGHTAVHEVQITKDDTIPLRWE